MGCKIIFAPEAIADLAEAILGNFPLIGAPYPKRPGIRKLVSRPYLIFYRPRLEAQCVDILRYWHGARGNDPEFGG